MGVEAKSQSRRWAPEFEPLPTSWTMSKIRAAIPSHLFERHASTSFYYLIRDILLATGFWRAASCIQPFCGTLQDKYPEHGAAIRLFEASAWILYWWFQGLIFTGLFVIGHECGHGAFCSSRAVCDVVGFIIHTFLFTPHFSWKYVHHRHHANHANLEKDETYIPKTRSDLGIPDDCKEQVVWNEYFGDTPTWAFGNLVTQQLLGFQAYMLYNASGRKDYPKWTSHYNPNSIYFTPEQFKGVVASDIGILIMLCASRYAMSHFGFWSYAQYYAIPWILVNHWTTMVTYLQHTDAELPHYRSTGWDFVRGATATFDRDFLGWQGRFFFHDVAHYHVVHHFFPRMPHYHCEEATKYLKKFLGEHYHYSDDYVFPTLWRTYNECQFVDDKGDVVFFRNKQGEYAIKNRMIKSGYTIK